MAGCLENSVERITTVIPSPTFMIASYAIGAVLVLMSALIFRSNIRVGDMPSWLLLVVLGPVPVLLGYPAATLAQLNMWYSLPAIAMTVLIGIGFFHLLLPSFIPDFQTDNIGISGFVAIMLGLSVFAGGLISKEFEAFFPFSDPSAVFKAGGPAPGETLTTDEAVERLMNR